VPNRREACAWLLAGAVASCLPSRPSRAIQLGGISVGAISYCFRSIPRPETGDPIDALIASYKACQLDLAELTWADVEPLPTLPMGGRVPIPITQDYLTRRQKVREWRLAEPLARYETIGRKFREAGIRLLSYAITISDDFSDEEIDKTLQAARAMGASMIGTNQSRMAMAEYIAPFAERHEMTLAFHNHANVADPNELASVPSLERVLGLSRLYRINLDVGHFVAGNNDPLAFIAAHHDRISHLHLKDRERDNGPNRPWGQGATPLVEILRLVRDRGYNIPCLIEYEYAGTGNALEEVQRCADFIRRAVGA
jgi:sugar phosphate isomerase/epimerase